MPPEVHPLEQLNLTDSQKIRKIQAAVQLVDQKAREAALAAPEDRAQAYRLLRLWASEDAVLEDALNSIGILMAMREQLVSQGELNQASSIEHLLAGHVATD